MILSDCFSTQLFINEGIFFIAYVCYYCSHGSGCTFHTIRNWSAGMQSLTKETQKNSDYYYSNWTISLEEVNLTCVWVVTPLIWIRGWTQILFFHKNMFHVQFSIQKFQSCHYSWYFIVWFFFFFAEWNNFWFC